MKTISFDQHNAQEILIYPKKAAFHIIKIHFISPNNKDWIPKVNNANLFVKITALNKQYRELASGQNVLSLSSFIDSNHVQPVLEVEQTINFPNHSPFQKSDQFHQWKIELTLTNLNFNEDESLSVLYTDV